MAFKMTPTPTFATLVTVNVPNDKGTFDKNTFMAFFKRPSGEDERKELSGLTHEELARRQMVGWDMKDEDTKEDVPFSKASLEHALSIFPTPLACTLAFWESVNGARTKNL